MSFRDILGGLPTQRQTLRSLIPDGAPPGSEIQVLLVNFIASAHVRTV
jgi:hypothetical protein